MLINTNVNIEYYLNVILLQKHFVSITLEQRGLILYLFFLFLLFKVVIDKVI